MIRTIFQLKHIALENNNTMACYKEKFVSMWIIQRCCAENWTELHM